MCRFDCLYYSSCSHIHLLGCTLCPSQSWALTPTGTRHKRCSASAASQTSQLHILAEVHGRHIGEDTIERPYGPCLKCLHNCILNVCLKNWQEELGYGGRAIVDADNGGRDLAGWPEVGEKGEQVLVLGEVLGRGRDGRSPVFHVPRGCNGELGGFLREMCKEKGKRGKGWMPPG
jgi:hypothetical protein